MNKINKAGYVLVKFSDHPNADKSGYVLEHRLIVEAKILRRLTPSEKIHHLDKNKKNNSIENLMLFKTAKEHSAFHIKVKRFGFTNSTLREIGGRWKGEMVGDEVSLTPT